MKWPLSASFRHCRRTILYASLTLVIVLCFNAGMSGAPHKHHEITSPFKEHLVATFSGGYQCSVTDINGDGKLDILGLSTSTDRVTWFQNPEWQPQVLAKLKQPIDLSPEPISGEIAIASGFDLTRTHDGGDIEIHKTLDQGQTWSSNRIGAWPTAHRLRWGNFSGKGKTDLIITPILGEGATAPKYTQPAPIIIVHSGYSSQQVETIDKSLTVIHGMRVVHFTNSKRDDLLLASFEGITLLSPPLKSGPWIKKHLADGDQTSGEKRGCSEIDMGRLPNGHRFLTTIEPWHGDKVVVYTEPSAPGQLWVRHVIDDTIEDGHALGCIDVLGEGTSDIVAGFRGKKATLYGYRCTDHEGLKWERYIIDSGNMAAAGIFIADINGDGKLDIVAIGTSTNNIKWYENVTVRKSKTNSQLH